LTTAPHRRISARPILFHPTRRPSAVAASSRLRKNVFHRAAGFLGLLAVLLFGGPIALALNSDLSMSQFAHDAWQRRDGLPSSVVLAITQTPDGFLWLGTPAGLARFDGVRFTEEPTNPNDLPLHEFISNLCAAPDNTLWIGVRNGGLRKLRNGVPTAIDFGPADPTVRALHLDTRGTLRIGTSSNLYELKDQQLVPVPSMANLFVTDLFQGPSSRLFVGAQNGIQIFDAGKNTSIPLPPSLGVIERVLEDRSGTVWIGTYQGLARWKDGHLDVYGNESGLLGEHVTALYEDRAGNIWVGTTDGLNRIRPGLTPRGDKADQVSLKNVLAILEDREGSLWIGTRDGLHRFKDVNIVPWTATEGLLSNVTPSLQVLADGTVLVFSSGAPTGLTRIKNGVITHRADVIDGPSYVDDDGALWIGSSGVLLRIQNQTVERFGTAEGLPSKWISTITGDRESLILCFSTMGGIRRWSNGTLQPYRLKDGTPFLIPYHVNSAHRMADDTIWMATYDGIWRFKDGDFTRYTSAAGEKSMQSAYTQNPLGSHHQTIVDPVMNDNWFTTIAEGLDSSVWFGSQRSGLIRWKNGKLSAMTAKDGLFSNEIFCVLVDDNGDLWMSSSRGIFRVAGTEIDAFFAGQRPTVNCRVYSTEDGMKTEEAMHEYQPAGWKAPNGILWFATRQGVVSINPRQQGSNTLPPPVIVEEVVVDGQSYTARAPAVIPPGGDKFEIHYTAMSLLIPDRVHFKYQLEGYDKAWVVGGRERVAHYTKLPPGDYRFRVIACNNDGVWNEVGASSGFSVRPFFYQTGWFVGTCILVSAGIVVGIPFWRVRQLRKNEIVLQEYVAQRTTELSRANSELKHEISERQRAEKEIERIHKQLLTASHQAGMAEVATGVLHNVGNALNSVNVSTSVLIEKVKQSRLPGLVKVVNLLREHENDLGTFLTSDAKGKRLPDYLEQLASFATTEQATTLSELDGLKNNVDHIRDIVARQQDYATVAGVVETVNVSDLVEDALRMTSEALARHNIELVRSYAPSTPSISVEKNKVVQILVNLIQNAKNACDEGPGTEKRILVAVDSFRDGVQVKISDTGIGIPPENMMKIFNHGFTTRKHGHGFGLHNGVLAAKELGGSLRVASKGLGHGATFTLELPLAHARKTV